MGRYRSFHEILCYISLHDPLSAELAAEIRPSLIEAVRAPVATDPEAWETAQVPTPLDFVGWSECCFGLSPDLIDANFDYYVE